MKQRIDPQHAACELPGCLMLLCATLPTAQPGRFLTTTPTIIGPMRQNTGLLRAAWWLETRPRHELAGPDKEVVGCATGIVAKSPGASRTRPLYARRAAFHDCTVVGAVQPQ
jgi:hypothetical protein